MELCKSQPTSKFDQFISSHGDIKTTTNNIYGSYKKGSFGSQTIDLVISSISRDASTKNRNQDNISQKTTK